VVFDEGRAEQFAAIPSHYEHHRSLVAVLQTVGRAETLPLPIELPLVFGRGMGIQTALEEPSFNLQEALARSLDQHFVAQRPSPAHRFTSRLGARQGRPAVCGGDVGERLKRRGLQQRLQMGGLAPDLGNMGESPLEVGGQRRGPRAVVRCICLDGLVERQAIAKHVHVRLALCVHLVIEREFAASPIRMADAEP